MSFNIISDWQNKNLRCHFCGETRSVKYKTKILIIDTIPNEQNIEEVNVCNKCALSLQTIFNN